MIAHLGVAIDAHALAATADPRERALAAQWVAANHLAIRRIRFELHGEPAPRGAVLGIDAWDLTGVLAAIACVPALLDPATVAWPWRLALKALGLPLLDGPARGASIARYRVETACMLVVDPKQVVRVELRSHLANVVELRRERHARDRRDVTLADLDRVVSVQSPSRGPSDKSPH